VGEGRGVGKCSLGGKFILCGLPASVSCVRFRGNLLSLDRVGVEIRANDLITLSLPASSSVFDLASPLFLRSSQLQTVYTALITSQAPAVLDLFTSHEFNLTDTDTDTNHNHHHRHQVFSYAAGVAVIGEVGGKAVVTFDLRILGPKEERKSKYLYKYDVWCLEGGKRGRAGGFSFSGDCV